MKLYPIFQHILTENSKLSNGNYWVDVNGRFNNFSCTHSQYVIKNIDKFDPPEDANMEDYEDIQHGKEFIFYNLAFDNGWVRLVVATSSFGKAANVEFNPDSVEPKAIENTFDSLLASNISTLYVDTVETDQEYTGVGGDVFRFSEGEDEKERFFKKYKRYLR